MKLVTAGLTATAEYWPAIRQAYEWVHEAARLLDNEAGLGIFELRREYRGLVYEMSSHREALGGLSEMVACFLKVSKSYWSGLFRCYEVSGLPRTNNDLEQCFGSVRYHERRATGRKGASPAMVVRGSVRLIAAVASRGQGMGATDIRPTDSGRYRELRAELEYRHQTRRAQCRFRRDPAAYLARLEEELTKPSLPS